MTGYAIALVTGRDDGVQALLARHAALMQSLTPEESCHVLTSDDLRASGSRVYGLWDADGALCAVGALKPFGADAVELKSMHVAEARRGQGLGRVLLARLLDAARLDGAVTAWLETGSEPPFAAARALYEGAGFTLCQPFADYKADPLSVFMTRRL